MSTGGRSFTWCLVQYKAISNSIDAGPVHDQARLKLQHGMDFKRFDRTTTER